MHLAQFTLLTVLYGGPLGQAALQMKVQKCTGNLDMQTGINIHPK